MSTLLADFFETNIPIRQKFKIENSNEICAIRLHIFKNGELLIGDLTVDLMDGSTILDTTTFTNAYLNTMIGNTHSHGMVTCIRDIRLGGKKSLEVSHEYELIATFTGSSFVLAWVVEYQSPFIGKYGSNLNNDAANPHNFEIWIYK